MVADDRVKRQAQVRADLSLDGIVIAWRRPCQKGSVRQHQQQNESAGEQVQKGYDTRAAWFSSLPGVRIGQLPGLNC